MFIHHQAQAFVLGETEKGEADKILMLFSREFGRIDVLAKAIRKMQSKLRGNISLFSLSGIQFIQGKSFKTLTGAILVNDFDNLKKDLERLKIAYKIADVFVCLVKPPQQDEKIWRLLKEVFEYLDNSQLGIKDLKIIYPYFFWRLLAILGYEPELYSCLVCHQQLKPKNLHFSVKGGIVCELCWQRNAILAAPVQVDAVKILREIAKRELKELALFRLSPENCRDLEKISSFYLASLLN